MDPNIPYIDEHGVLHDDSASGLIKAVTRENARIMLHDSHRDRVRHFVGRIADLGRSPKDVVIVVICVDDPIGGPLSEQLMPGHDWSAIRATGATPFARGLAGRLGLQEVVDALDPAEGERLLAIDGVAVIMVISGIVLVCPASDLA